MKHPTARAERKEDEESDSSPSKKQKHGKGSDEDWEWKPLRAKCNGKRFCKKYTKDDEDILMECYLDFVKETGYVDKPPYLRIPNDYFIRVFRIERFKDRTIEAISSKIRALRKDRDDRMGHAMLLWELHAKGQKKSEPDRQ